jgi:hypothetical protein
MKKLMESPEKEFIVFAALHHDLSATGDAKGSDDAHSKVTSAIKKIRNSRDNGQAYLEKTVQHKNPSVRLWAATYLLPLNTGMALKVLHQLERGNCPWQLQATAEVVLDQWKTGKLKLE